jgi:hypothetical protein
MSEQKKREPTRGGVMVVPPKNIKALSFNGVAMPGQGKTRPPCAVALLVLSLGLCLGVRSARVARV